MICSTYVRDAKHHSMKVCLRCDGCRKETPTVFVEPYREIDEWTRLSINSDGWTRRLDGRMLKDYCPACRS